MLKKASLCQQNKSKEAKEDVSPNKRIKGQATRRTKCRKSSKITMINSMMERKIILMIDKCFKLLIILQVEYYYKLNIYLLYF